MLMLQIGENAIFFVRVIMVMIPLMVSCISIIRTMSFEQALLGCDSTNDANYICSFKASEL